MLGKHRDALDLVAHGLLEKETLVRPEFEELFAGVAPESDSAATVGKVVPLLGKG